MNYERFQIIGKNYRAIALNENVMADCLSHYLKKRDKLSENARRQIEDATAWAHTAQVGEVFDNGSFSIRVLDVKSIKAMSAFDLFRQVPVYNIRKSNN